MYIVCFERADRKPNEQYFYLSLEEAKFHFNLFREDDSGLYNVINLLQETNGETKQLETLAF